MSADDRKRKARSPVQADSSYEGFTFPSNGKTAELDRVDASIDPKRFFQEYVARRKPCILTGSLIKQPISVNVLRSVAGNVKVQVEKRLSSNDHFGQNRTPSRQIIMTVAELLDSWECPTNREIYYLSTQSINDDDSSPFLGPCQKLQPYFLPDNLPLAGNLILHSCNLWMGCASASSGLHHDFHDNYYILSAGRKTVRLYAPNEYSRMETFGKVDCLYANGLISYEDNPTRSDGVPISEIEDGESESEVETDPFQSNADRNNSAGFGSTSSAAVDDCKNTEEWRNPVSAKDSTNPNAFSSDDEEELFFGKGFDLVSSDDDNDAVGHALDDTEAVDDYDDLEHSQEMNETCAPESRPSNFSAIDPLLPRTRLEQNHPDFLSCKECIVELNAGESLYIPASWFHFVTSYPSEGDENVHMAINYWMYPPDRLDRFDDPYADGLLKQQLQ